MAPTISLGTPNAGTTGATTYVWPSHQADDILLVTVEAQDSATGTPSTPSGMAHTASSPRSQSSAATNIATFWKRATSSAESDVIVPAVANHQSGIPFSIRGGLATGNPWDVATSTGQSSASGTRTFSGITTLTADSLIVWMLATDPDSTVDTFGTLNTPSGVTSFSVLSRIATDNGGGGQILVASGIKATAGFAGSLTWTFAAAQPWTGIALVFPPTAATVDFEGFGVPI